MSRNHPYRRSLASDNTPPPTHRTIQLPEHTIRCYSSILFDPFPNHEQPTQRSSILHFGEQPRRQLLALSFGELGNGEKGLLFLFMPIEHVMKVSERDVRVERLSNRLKLAPTVPRHVPPSSLWKPLSPKMHSNAIIAFLQGQQQP
jgi:hypothetical protein